MPYVKNIIINDQSNSLAFADAIALAGPQIKEVRRKWLPNLEIYITKSLDLSDLKCNLKDSFEKTIFKLVYFKCTYYDVIMDVKFTTQELICHSLDYYNNVFIGLLKLTLFNVSSFLAEDLSAIQKALQEKHLKSLELNGILTDALISRMHFKSHSLTRLYLHFQGVCNWDTARCLQTSTPNIEYFGLRSSNLMSHQLDNFDWSLWPNLKGLDFENNYTLVGQINVPKTLKKLYIAFTKAIVDLPEGLEDFSSNVFYFQLVSLKHIRKLRLHFLSFWLDDYETIFKDFQTVEMSILFKEYFDEKMFKSVRSQMPRCFVKKLQMIE
jgi:hypothetical protein